LDESWTADLAGGGVGLVLSCGMVGWGAICCRQLPAIAADSE
jgi:hypothetical protein